MKYAYLISSLAWWINVIYGKSATNLAIKRPAWQSTTFDGSGHRNVPYYANKSVDGNKDTNIDNGGCSRTKTEDNPWWVVGLHREYCITTVTITWRNYNSQTQNRVFLAVGTTFNEKQFKKEEFYQCVKIQEAANGETKNYNCSGIRGSFVSLYRSDKSTHIEMCEVEVNGYKGICAVNLALGKQARQISTYNDNHLAFASNAVDGNKETDFNKGGCSHTRNTYEATTLWWVVFLDQEYHITKVTITWRNDWALLVNGAEILIGSSFKELNFERKEFVKCADISGLPRHKAPQSSFNCNQKKGSSVSIYFSTPANALASIHMCEVEVFGFKGPEQTIQDGRIYQFNYEALVHSKAVQKCKNRKRTLLSSVHVEQRDIKPYVSAQMVRLGLNQSWISKTGIQCSYILNNTTISMTACDDRYGYVCISEPKEPFVISLRRYSIYITKVNFSYAQETCNSKNQTIIKQSDITNAREKLKKHGLESIWIVTEKLRFNISTRQCMAYNINSDSGPMYSNCTNSYAFVCGEDQSSPPTTVGSTATKAIGRLEHWATNGMTTIPVTGTITTCTVPTALTIISACFVLAIIINVVQCVIIWWMRNRLKQHHSNNLKLPGNISVDDTHDGCRDKRTFEPTASRDPKADTTAYYSINDVQQRVSTKEDDTYTHLELRIGADLEAQSHYEQLKT